jgi:hypothetical protein
VCFEAVLNRQEAIWSCREDNSLVGAKEDNSLVGAKMVSMPFIDHYVESRKAL